MTEEQTRAAGLTEAQIDALNLAAGKHESPESGMCLLEATAIFANEPFGDQPPCVDAVLGAMGRSWNDMLPEADRQQLKKYIPLLPGTNEGPALSAKRSFMALDWFIRVHFPMWLEQLPEVAEHAAKLRALAPITIELGEAERTIAVDLVKVAVRAARDARAARAAWDAWAAWDARDAWAAWAACEAVALTVAFEAAKGSGSYDEARAKADAIFAARRDEVREQMHALYLDMINAKLDDAAALDRADQAEE